MGGRRAGLVFACTLLLAGAGTAAAAGPVAPAAQMVLAPSDFPGGAQLVKQQSTPMPAFGIGLARSSAYTREFANAAFHDTDLASVVSSAIVTKQASAAAKYMVSLEEVVRSAAARKTVATGAAASFGASAKTTVKSAQVVRARILHLPDETIDIALRLTLAHGSLILGELWIDKGPALSGTIYLAPGSAGESLAVALARLVDGHIQIATAPAAPADSVAPTVTGSPAVGQTLTVDRGTWQNPAEFGLQWLRCSASGTPCAAISGQTGSTYVVTSADIGSTLSVDVTATNGAGTDSVQAPASAVVAG